ncbi:MAG: hypothetical protein LBC39_05475 [Methanobrevibacter sp.]|nr:hypothetical protein [Candidatus Methanovirga aequatorialis]
MEKQGKILLISTYESGFQSIGVSIAANYFSQVNIEFDILDISLDETISIEKISSYDLVGFYLPMFHCMEFALDVTKKISKNENHPQFFYFGLYSDIYSQTLSEFSDQCCQVNFFIFR